MAGGFAAWWCEYKLFFSCGFDCGNVLVLCAELCAVLVEDGGEAGDRKAAALSGARCKVAS